jgi:hypothetical protein
MLNQTNSGYDRIQRKYDVKYGDLQQYGSHAGSDDRLPALFYAFEAVVYFMSGFVEQE